MMRPELINRLDAIVVFHALTRKNVEAIFDNLVGELKHRLGQRSLGLKIDKSVKTKIIDRGFDPKNGARPLRRAIEDLLESAISEEIIAGHLVAGDIIEPRWQRGKIKLEVAHE